MPEFPGIVDDFRYQLLGSEVNNHAILLVIAMNIRFDESKATQVAAYFLGLRGGQMHYIKLIKLMYLGDREALLRWGAPISTDRHISMENGPALSRVLNLITEERPKPIWAEYISGPLGEYEVKLLKPGATDRLSRAEENLMREIFEQYGHRNRWDLIDNVMRKLPEWQNPSGSAIPISFRDILKAGGESEAEIHTVLKELSSFASDEERFARVYA